jgi:Fe2+ transport system protein FeoA
MRGGTITLLCSCGCAGGTVTLLLSALHGGLLVADDWSQGGSVLPEGSAAWLTEIIAIRHNDAANKHKRSMGMVGSSQVNVMKNMPYGRSHACMKSQAPYSSACACQTIFMKRLMQRFSAHAMPLPAPWQMS